MMTKTLLLLTSVAALHAQDASRPEFGVATIRPSAQAPQEGATAGVRIDGAQVRCAFLTLKDYIGMAYQVKLYQVSGPDWLGSDRFDIAATLPPGSSMSQLPQMMQRLLEERFQVKIHREKKDFPVYALEVAKSGLKMQESGPEQKRRASTPERPRTSPAADRLKGFLSIWGEDLLSPSQTAGSRPSVSAWLMWPGLWNALWTGRWWT